MKFASLIFFSWFALFFTPPGAQAESILAIGMNTVYETGANGRAVETRQPVSIRGGYRFLSADLFLEYTNFRVSQGTSLVYVSREHQEFILWARHIFLPEWTISPYVSFGAGVQNDRIDTVLGGQAANDDGAPQSMAASAAGLRARIFEKLDLQLEGRLSVSSNYAPNPLFGFGILAGFAF